MATNPQTIASLETGGECDATLAVNPFEALKPHFGMLLGVQDFQTIDAYHRGKQWLHSAWLHRHGVVWGLQVSIDTPRDEIRVEPGLAIDALGRELYLPRPVCLNLPKWLEKHRDDEQFNGVFDQPGDVDIRFTVHVVIGFKACLARQVPALMEPCEGSSSTTAYSRIMETVEVGLKPGLAPAVGDANRLRPYHRLRLLFNLEDPISDDDGVIDSDQEVIAERNRILALPASQQQRAYLDGFREFAALDEMEMSPANSGEGEAVSIFPALEPSLLVLADLEDLLVRRDDLRGGTANNKVRDTLVATATIQELLCGPLFRHPAVADGGDGAPDDGDPDNVNEDAGGPRIDPDSVAADGNTLDFVHAGPDLLRRSVQGDVSVSVSTYEVNSGWTRETISDIQFEASTVKISVNRADALGANLVRLIVKGSGPTPVLGNNRVPLAGAVGGPPGTEHQGNDFVFLLKSGG